MPGNNGSRGMGTSVFVGGLIVALGGIFLANNLGLLNLGGGILQWWPLILIAVGVWLLISSGFRNLVAPLILIGIGTIFLTGNLLPSIDILDYWPAILIAVGALILVRALRSSR